MSATVATSNRTAKSGTVRLGRHSRQSVDSMDCRHIFDSLYYVFRSKKGKKFAVGTSAKMRQDQGVGQTVIVKKLKEKDNRRKIKKS